MQAQVDYLNRNQQDVSRISERLKEKEYHRGVLLSQRREKEAQIQDVNQQRESYEKAVREIKLGWFGR